MNGPARAGKWMIRMAAVVAVLLTAVLPAAACDTPVYRFAMYNWRPTPYLVVYFYEGEVREADKPIHEQLGKLQEDYDVATNVVLETVDASQEDNLKVLPKMFREALAEYRQDKPLPAYFVFAPPHIGVPYGATIFSGNLAAEDVKAMVESPARKKLAEELHKGRAGVLLLLSGKDAEQTARAEKETLQAIKPGRRTRREQLGPGARRSARQDRG